MRTEVERRSQWKKEQLRNCLKVTLWRSWEDGREGGRKKGERKERVPESAPQGGKTQAGRRRRERERDRRGKEAHHHGGWEKEN